MKSSQAPSSVLMVRPASFGFNLQTAATNAFQSSDAESQGDTQQKALEEFNRMVDTLLANDVDVIVINDTPEPRKPDAVFPNNWISFHHDGKIVLYPMMAENRRLERKIPVVDSIKTKFRLDQLIDLSEYEKVNQFLEGSGSVVFDYQNKIAYASRSARTHETALLDLCRKLNFKPILFDAVDETGQPIYHTNVLMCIGTKFVVVCLDAIRNDEDQETLLHSFAETGHQVIAISYEQLRLFAGNMMEVLSRSGEPLVLMSEKAFTSLLPGQLNAISKHAEPIAISIPTIEHFGGGSVRCMLAGIFNQKL
ncbi:MAG TPA: arginine deiminase-related protein [Cyclobacteriaceae bacterium]|nr:arginine deiminase-related protein [Cyclobacteriaceae bacterium]